MAGESLEPLERFFAEVSPRLETAQTLDDELDRQLARRFNVFRYLRTDELGFSRMIADLLDPAGDHGQGATFLRLLTAKLGFAKDANLAGAQAQTERSIDVDGRRRLLDICVEIDSKHCVVIESKSNDAGDQEDQVEDYLTWLERNYQHTMLVYLSPTGDSPSELSVASETIKALEEETPKRFVIMPCSSSDVSDDSKLRLPFSLVDWLADCRRNCDVDRLRWYLRETETYCRQRYGGNTVTDSKKSAVEKFVRGNKENVATALAVYETWPKVASDIKCEFLEMIFDNRPDAMLRHDDWYWDWGYGQRRFESYIFARRKCWRPYLVDGQEKFTGLYLEASSKGSSGWYIGVWSPAASDVSEDGRKRRERLQEELGKLGKLGKPEQCWPYMEWVQQEYGNWNALSLELSEELREGSGNGDICTFFINKFQEVARETTDIIDNVERV